jgi:hypothetical protein
MAVLTPSAEMVADGLSEKTGLDINVVRAWVAHESAWGRSPAGAYNFLNLRDPNGGWAQFSSADDAVNAYYAQLQRGKAFGYPAILTSSRNSPQYQISTIAASKWDASHYGGTGGPNLVSTYNSVLQGYQGGAGTLSEADKATIKTAFTSGKLGATPEKPWGTIHIPGDGDIALGGVIKIVGGAVLGLVALVLILFSVGLKSGAAGTAIEAIPGGSLVKRAGKSYARGVSDRRAIQNAPPESEGAVHRDGRRRSQFKTSEPFEEAS